MMLDRDTVLVPTLLAPGGVLAAAEAGLAVPEESVRRAREVVARHEESFRLAVASGVRIAMGTDAGVVPHGTNLREIERMAQLGMGTVDALRSATSEAARLLGWGDLLGSIEPGKAADLVVVEGDPLADLAGLSIRVRAVWRSGRPIRPAAGEG